MPGAEVDGAAGNAVVEGVAYEAAGGEKEAASAPANRLLVLEEYRDPPDAAASAEIAAAGRAAAGSAMRASAMRAGGSLAAGLAAGVEKFEYAAFGRADSEGIDDMLCMPGPLVIPAVPGSGDWPDIDTWLGNEAWPGIPEEPAVVEDAIGGSGWPGGGIVSPPSAA